MRKTDDNHLHSGNPPEHASFVIPIQYESTRTAGQIFMYFIADIDYEVVRYVPFPISSSGTVTYDIKADSVSLLSTKPTATTLAPVVAAVFSTTRIESGAMVTLLVDSGSAATATTGTQGLLVLRPLLGKERT